MPRYEARIDLTGSSADLEKSIGTIADSGEDAADRLEQAFSDASDKASGSLSGLVDDSATSLSGIGDAAEDNAGRLTTSFGESASEVSAGLDDLAGTATEKSEIIAGKLSAGFDDAAGASEAMVGKVTESLDALVAETTERATLISTRLDEAFAKSALAAEKLNAGSLAGAGGGVTSQAELAGQLEQIEALQKKGVLTAEQTAAARSKALGTISGGSLEEQVGVVGGLASGGLISDAEADAAKAKLVGLGSTADEELGAGLKGKIASAFKGLGSSLGNFGLPFAEQFNKMGDSIEGAKTKAGSLKATLSSVGQLTTEIGAAAVIGFGAESIHLSDLYDTALTSLKVAVKNSGEAWDAYAPKLKVAQSESAKLGFNSTEVAQTLQALTTATNKPAEALKYLGEAENLAREKSEPLSDATQALVKLFGGSTRALTQMGVNLDIGSGKLHSVQSATETVTKAQMSLQDAVKAASQTGVVGSQNQVQAMLSEQKAALSLSQAHLSGSDAVANALEGQKAAQAEVESGQIKGASAVAALNKSQMTLTESIESGGLRNQSAALSYMKALDSTKDTTERDSYAQVAALEKVQTAEENLNIAKLNKSEDVNAISDALGALNQRTKGAASAYAQTLPGQLKVLDAEIHNVGTSFGEFLTPKLEEAAKGLGDVLGWFEKNKLAAEVLGGTIAGVLGLAVAVFAEQKLVKFGGSLKNAWGDLQKFEKGVSSAAGKIADWATGGGQSASTSEIAPAAEGAQSSVSSIGPAAEGSAATVSDASTEMASSLGEVATAAETTAATTEVSLTSISDAAEATADTEEVAGAEGGEGIAAMLGPIGLVAFAALEIATHWKLVKEVLGDVWHFLDNDVVHPMEHGFDWLKDEIDSHLSEIEDDAKKFGPALLLLLGPIGLIADGAIELVKHWKTVSKTFDEVEGDLKRGWDTVEGDAKHLWDTVEGDTKKGVDDVVRFVGGLPGDVEKLFADAGTWLLDAGENIFKGLLSGIEGEAEKGEKDLEDIGKKVLHDLSHPWDILSPSKATAEQGAFLIQGVPVGMRRELPALLSEVDAIGKSVIDQFGKLDGRDAGKQFVVDFSDGIRDSAHFADTAIANLMKGADESALRTMFANGMNFGTTKGGQPLSPGSSSVTQYNMPNAQIVANDPTQLARALNVKTRRKNSVRT